MACYKESIFEGPYGSGHETVAVLLPGFAINNMACYKESIFEGPYGSGHETVAVLLPGFAINW